MAFKDLADALDVEPLVLPIRGREYACPGSISAKTWLWMQYIMAIARGEDVEPKDEALTDQEQANILNEMLGDAKQQMLDDGLTSAEMEHVERTLWTYHANNRNRALAESVWNSLGKAPAPNRASRRAAEKSPRSRGSRAGSTPRKRSPKARPGAPSSSAGS